MFFILCLASKKFNNQSPSGQESFMSLSSIRKDIIGCEGFSLLSLTAFLSVLPTCVLLSMFSLPLPALLLAQDLVVLQSLLITSLISSPSSTPKSLQLILFRTAFKRSFFIWLYWDFILIQFNLNLKNVERVFSNYMNSVTDCKRNVVDFIFSRKKIQEKDRDR